MKRNWVWWFERTGWFVAGILGFVTYRLIDHQSAFLIWALAAGVVTVLFNRRKTKSARQAYAEYLQREQPKKEQKWFKTLAAGAKAGLLERQRLKKEQKQQKS